MGIKGNRWRLWMGISHYRSHDRSSTLVFSPVVSRSHLGSNERVHSRYGSVTGWGERLSRPVVRVFLSNLYAGSKGTGDAKRHEEGGARQSGPRLFRAQRCDSKTTQLGLTVLSRALACGGTQVGI